MEKPILFSGAMVRAILEGRKTQTRRIVKVQPPTDEYQLSTLVSTTGSRSDLGKTHWLKAGDAPDYNQPYWNRPYAVGDLLWVKETFMPMPHLNAKAFYRASDPLVGGKWKPSIFMPRALSRITLEVVSVRVERLNDISEEDAIAEGVRLPEFPGDGSARLQFFHLWGTINGPDSLETNPWLWVVEFKKIGGPTA